MWHREDRFTLIAPINFRYFAALESHTMTSFDPSLLTGASTNL